MRLVIDEDRNDENDDRGIDEVGGGGVGEGKGKGCDDK